MIMLLLFLMLPLVFSLLPPGFFPSHDGEWMVVRLSDFHRSFVSGQIPVRWAARLNHQFGYPVFNFLYPLPLYLGEFFHLIGFDFVQAIKAVFILSFFLSGIFMYLWLKEKWGRLAGLMAALLYVYAPYRLVDVYVRGSLGEALAFVFPPLLFWQIEKPSRQNQIVAGLAFAGLIMSHNTMAMLFSGLLVGWLFLPSTSEESRLVGGPPRRSPTAKRVTAAILLGLGLSCFFWLPALWDQQFTFFRQTRISNFFLHFPSLKQLLLPSWGYGPSLPLSLEDGISFQVGLLSLAVAALSLFWWRKLKFWVSAFWLAFFLMLAPSWWLWRLFPVYNLIQFPWRLLALTTFIASVLGGFLVSQASRRWQKGLVIILALVLVWQGWQYARPAYFSNQPLGFYTTNEDTTTVGAEYTPIWVKEMPDKRAKQKVEIIAGSGEISDLDINSRRVAFRADLSAPSRLRLNTHYFPGWKLVISAKGGPASGWDGQRQPIDYEQAGLIDFSLPGGQYSVMAVFKETPLRLLADLVSLISVLVVLFLLKK